MILKVALASTFFFLSVFALDSTEVRLLNYAKKSKSSLVQFVEKIVNINSSSLNPAGVNKVGTIFKNEFEALGMKTEVVFLPDSFKRGHHLFATTWAKGKPAILLIGHLDTVFTKSSPFQSFERKGNIAFGPGVNDMKGGLGVILYALKALKREKLLSQMNITVALMSDEEEIPRSDTEGISRRKLIELSKSMDVALGFEYAVESMQKVAISRRGYRGWEIKVTAKQGHSSKIGSAEYGHGAIIGLSQMLTRMQQTSLKYSDLTFNPGIIKGGTNVAKGRVEGKNNIIAPIAIASGDIRTLNPVAEKAMIHLMRSFEKAPFLHSKVKVTFFDSYPPMPPTKKNKELLSFLSDVSQELGYGKLSAVDPNKRGAADTSFVAPHVPYVLDGLGLLGTGAHSPSESIELDKLPVSVGRTAIFLKRIVENKVFSEIK